MAKIRFKNGIVEDYTIILSTRDYRHQGQIVGVKSDTVEYVGNLNSANEFSFTVCKFDLVKDRNFLSDEEYERYCKEMEILWERIVDFKLIYVKELDEYYDIRVSLEDAAETIKTITATSLCESELSHLNIDSLEINTEADIEIQSDEYAEYGGTVFYDENNTERSLLHRVIADKAPHYHIKHVDKSLINLVRTFSVSGTSIYDFLTGDVAEQFNCLFIFDSTTRGISAYDLYTVCLNPECGHRDEFFEIDEVTGAMKCPKCGCADIVYFGNDTTIYIDKTNLTDSIRVETNADEVKNCLKMEAADELMTATIQMLNPNGSKYLYALTEYQRKDMPEELVERVVGYNTACDSCADEHESLVSQYYQLNDDKWYLDSGMMPTIEHVKTLDDITDPRPSVIYTTGDNSENYTVYIYQYNEETHTGQFVEQTESVGDYYENLFPKIDAITAESEGKNLIKELLSNDFMISLTSMHDKTSVATVNTAIKNYARAIVKSGYVKVEIDTEKDVESDYDNTFIVTVEEDKDGYKTYTGVWTGRFIITNYSDEEDIYTTSILTINVDTDYENYLRQKVLKESFEDDEDGSIFNILDIDDLEVFKNALTFYSLERLQSFYSAIEGAMTALQSAEQAEQGAVLYDEMYYPFFQKLEACTAEINKRQVELDAVEKNIETVTTAISNIQDALDFRSCIGEEYYKIFCAYRREDTYNNSNYSSEGLSNVELIKKAKEFIENAKQELKRISEPQITLTSSLKNFLILPEFEPLVKSGYFELGNWIRVKVDGVLYDKVRLIGYNISFGNLQEIGVQFSSVTKERNVANDAKEIIQSAKSMSTSFGYVSKQAEKGSSAKDNLNDMSSNGLNSGLMQIKNNQNEEVTYGKHGILCRSFDDTIGEYSPEQVRFTHNVMAFTNNNWKTTEQIIGKHTYVRYDRENNAWIPETGYGMTAKFVTADTYVTGATIVGGEILSTNYSNGTNGKPVAGTYIDLNNGAIIGGKIYSTNYNDGITGVSEGTYIDLDEGELNLAGGGLTYSKAEGLKIESIAIEDALENISVVPENLKIKAINIDTTDGKITAGQISSILPSQIDTKNTQITSDQIESIDIDKVDGVYADRIVVHNGKKITADKIDVTDLKLSASHINSIPISKIEGTKNGLIQSNQIDSINFTQIDGDIIADSVDASDIDTSKNKIASSQIESDLNNKNVTGTFDGDSSGTFEGTATLSSITTTDEDENTYNTITGEFTIGEMTLKFINGLLVNATPVENIE